MFMWSREGPSLCSDTGFEHIQPRGSCGHLFSNKFRRKKRQQNVIPSGVLSPPPPPQNWKSNPLKTQLIRGKGINRWGCCFHFTKKLVLRTREITCQSRGHPDITPQLTATTNVHHTRTALHIPGRPRKRTFVRGTVQFPLRFAKRAAEPVEVAKPDRHEVDICYKADGEWTETAGAPREPRGPTSDGASVRSMQRHKAKERTRGPAIAMFTLWRVPKNSSNAQDPQLEGCVPPSGDHESPTQPSDESGARKSCEFDGGTMNFEIAEDPEESDDPTKWVGQDEMAKMNPRAVYQQYITHT